MLASKALLFLSLLFSRNALSQRPSNTSICDYHTAKLLGSNTAENQYKFVNLLVNTVIIGNFAKEKTGVAVVGILSRGTFQGKSVNLLPYFNGQLASSNRGGQSGVAINFLDDGGAYPIKMDKPANGKNSNQYKLMTHLYQYFGALLHCTQYGKGAFPAYSGQKSMFQVHRFMDLDTPEVGFFVSQVGRAAASFGVSSADVKTVSRNLNRLFGQRCSPPKIVIKEQGQALQSICIVDSCPLNANATCSAYPSTMNPLTANSTTSNMTVPESSTSVTMSPTANASPQQTNNAAARPQVVGGAAAVAILSSVVMMLSAVF